MYAMQNYGAIGALLVSCLPVRICTPAHTHTQEHFDTSWHTLTLTSTCNKHTCMQVCVRAWQVILHPLIVFALLAKMNLATLIIMIFAVPHAHARTHARMHARTHART